MIDQRYEKAEELYALRKTLLDHVFAYLASKNGKDPETGLPYLALLDIDVKALRRLERV